MRISTFAPVVIGTISIMYALTVSAETIGLDDAISEALANNPRLKRASAISNSIEARKWDEILPGNPALFAEYEGIPQGDGIGSYDERMIGISQEFAFPLEYFYLSRRHSQTYREAASIYRQATLQVTREVTEAFYRVLAIREQLALQREYVQYSENLLEHARIKAETGEVTKYEPLRAQVELAEAMTRFRELENDQQYYLYHLKLLLGRSKTDSLDINGTLAVIPVTFDADSLKEVAMTQHPLLSEALSRLEQRRIDYQLAKTSLLPNLSLRYFDQQYRGNDTPAWGGEIAITLPLWDIVKAPGRIRAASYSLDAEGWELESLKRSILESIEKAVNDVTVAHDQVVNYQDAILAEVEELVRITEQSYTEGAMGYLDVIESLRTMQRTRSGYLSVLYQYHAAFSALESAIGTKLMKPGTSPGEE